MENKKNRQPILEMKHICKTFPGVKALDDVSIDLYEGEVLALLGENGAGKSTLINILTGIFGQDSGEIIVRGKPVKISVPRDAFGYGINVVHQERTLCGAFSITENLFLERIARKMCGWIDMKKMYKDAKQYLDMVQLDVDPRESVMVLEAGQQQLLEIARTLSTNAKIIILDEPTASISNDEVDMLMNVVSKLRDEGYSFIFVSHKLEEVFRLCDRVCVLRDGKRVGDITSISELNRDSLIVKMIGREEDKDGYPQRDKTDMPVVLEADQIFSKNNPTPNSFQLHKGEILGWYGLVGAGRTELARELVGMDPVTGGKLTINNKEVVVRDPKDALKHHRIAYVSENRNTEGLFLTHDIVANVNASVLEEMATKRGFMKRSKEVENAKDYIKKLSIKTPSENQLVVNLSGGNRQKVSVAKVLAANPDIVIIDEPTVGIDIKAKEELHDIVYKIAEEGVSVIFISSDLREMIRVADRILVFESKKIAGELFNEKDYGVMSKKVMAAIQSNS